MTDPAYSNQLEWVKLWNDFPGRFSIGKTDTGIDLVAKTLAGEYWAIQCKCYAEDTEISKSDMDTFIATSGRTFEDEYGNRNDFSLRMVVATTDKWSSNAADVLHGQKIPATILGLDILNNAQVNWGEIEKGVHGEPARGEKHTLRPHQQDALDAAINHYEDHSRGKMIMACGTGKTFTSLKIAEELISKDISNNLGKKGCVLFLAPSIALVGQTLREWVSNTDLECMNAICVCSDSSVSKKSINDDDDEFRIEELGLPATTDPQEIVSRYESSDRTTVIFSTYQSIDAVCKAQEMGIPEFNIIVCDEAHRTTGAMAKEEKESNFVKVHYEHNIQAHRRLYMTATPRLYGDNGKKKAKEKSITLCSMDDGTLYGDEFYNISFGEAVDMGLLSDYKVLILTMSDEGIPDIIKRQWSSMSEIAVDTDCKLWGCINALDKNLYYDKTLKNTDPSPMRSAVSFCRSIKVSRKVSERFNELAYLPDSPRKATMDHVDGSMNAMIRQGKIDWLKKGADEECHILSNVRCLSEGVDVPALDAIIFLDSKSSIVDVVQSVGRVMRKAEGKRYGYIIIPIVISKDESPEDALDDNKRYKIVWDVLRALRSHDERLDAEINTLNLRKDNSGGHIHIGQMPFESEGDSELITLLENAQYTLDDFGKAMFARLVTKVGDREYIENWARDVAKVMPTLMDRLKEICTGKEYDDGELNDIFSKYLSALRMSVNEEVTEEDAVKMLAQQIVTKPIFEKLFGQEGFVEKNSISKTIDSMLNDIESRDGLQEIDDQLQDFYKRVDRTMSMIDTAEGKQKVITALYEKFFKNAFPKDQSINGVVYTPIEIVDFILNSVAGVLNSEFDKDINDPDVNVLDPFTGTGTFIARLLESGLISKENLERKYKNELFANEITLLAYYIAAVNIENTYARVTGIESYTPFKNILLTDTFNIEEICRKFGSSSQTKLTLEDFFYKNREVIRKENDTPITLIVGNPPYGAIQKSANDDAKKRKYDSGIDSRILKTYLDDSLFLNKKGNVNSVYDNYVRAFRWASDRLRGEDGIIAFVTPNGWLTGSAFEGFRKTFEKEFSKIFIFDLRGDQNSGDWRKEGEKIFGEGSKVGISITLLVKHSMHTDLAKIHYFKVPDCSKRVEKLNLLCEKCAFSSMSKKDFKIVKPKENGDWIIQRNEAFNTLIPLAGDTHNKFEKHYENTIFTGYTNGYKTNRDVWIYNYSKNKLAENIQNMIDEYSFQIESDKISYDSKKIKWSGTLERYAKQKRRIVFDENLITTSSYRPFCYKWFYNEPDLIEGNYQNSKIHSNSNYVICVSGVGDKKEFSTLITNGVVDLHLTGTSQCFPLYWYENPNDRRNKNKQSTLDGELPIIKHDGISNYAKNTASEKYKQQISKEDIFYYTYGYLHSQDYRDAFSNDLKMTLPRIDFVDYYEDFLSFVEAGRKLAYLHTNYEKIEPYYSVTINGKSNSESIQSIIEDKRLHHVTKMKLIPKKHKLIYNEHITIEDIPQDAFDYTISGRSAIAWIVNQYQIKTDKASGIIDDPNEFAGGTYILKLILSVINVSVQTMKIVRNLPKLSFENNEE